MTNSTGGRIAIFTLLLTLLPSGAVAQWDTININGTNLRLGMKQSEVLAALAETSVLKKFSDIGDSWCVQPKDHAGRLPWDCAPVGSRNNKLYTATSELGFASDTAAASLLNRLYLAISQAEKSGMPVGVHTQPERQLKTEQRVRTLSVFIGRKEFSLTITQPIGISGPSFTTLSESVYAPQASPPPSERQA